MTTSKKITTTADYVKDTAKGKKHFSVDGEGVAGAIYLSPSQFKALGEPDALKVEVSGA